MAFNLPLQNYFSRTTGPAVYSRPSDWPVITDVATEVQFLFCDLGDAACTIKTQFTRTSGSQNIIIDWGDATTSTVTATASTDTPHTYTPGTGTPCTLGYTTFKIRVYFTGTGVSVLDNCNILPLLISGNTASSQICYVLEAYYGNSTQNATAVNFYSLSTNSSNTKAKYFYLQFVKLPATVSWSNWSITFTNCLSLVKIIMPTSNAGMNSLNNAFNGCSKLLEFTFPSNAINVSDLNTVFINCSSLKSVTFPTSLNSCSTMSNMFGSCVNLRNVTLPSINNCSQLSFIFYGCFQLEWVKFTSMPTVASVNMFYAFNQCYNLQNVYFPATGTATSVYNFNSTFQSAYQLKTIVLPSNIKVSEFANTFNNCYALTSCILPTNAPNCSTYSSMFSGCASLLKITLPTASSATVGFDNIFNSCFKLETIIIPSGYTVSNLQFAFYNNQSLKTLSWTPGIQNSLTSMFFTFGNCFLLTNITLPTSMNALTTLNQTFNTCISITSLTFPLSLNAVTTAANCFSVCILLTSVTLPTSMSACTNFSGMFFNCTSILNITLPNIVGAVTTFNSTFSPCASLKTCVLPGAAQLSLVTDINAIFNECSNLVTITNFDKIGSSTATPLVSATGIRYNRFTGGSAISFSGPLSILNLSGESSVLKTDVQAVRLLNASAGQWTGSSPQINVSFTNMSTAQIVQLFNDMAAQGNVVSKTINITSATGAAALTAADRLIVTSKGWTITG